MKHTWKVVEAFRLGILDGYRQPHGVNMSYNLDHLNPHGMTDLYAVLDRGINCGQFLRAGFRAESWILGYVFPRIPRKV